MGKAPGPKPGAPAPPRTRRRHSTVEDPRMGWVGTRSIQSFILYLSDALDTDACAPVKSSALLMFWSMSEIGIVGRSRVSQNRKKSILGHPAQRARLSVVDWAGSSITLCGAHQARGGILSAFEHRKVLTPVYCRSGYLADGRDLQARLYEVRENGNWKLYWRL